MKITAIFFAAAALIISVGQAQNLSGSPSKEMVKEAIEAFCKSPLSPEGKKAGDVLMRFAGDSRNTNYVFYALFPEFHVNSRQEPNVSKEAITVLLRASMAGNFRPQLKANVKRNHPHEGLQQMLKTYSQLKESDKSLKIARLEELAAMESKGVLKAHVDEVVKRKSYPLTLEDMRKKAQK